MAALQKPYETYERPGIVVAYKTSNVNIFKGALLGLNASGFVVPMAHGTASLKFVGVANESVSNSAGPAGAVSVNVTKSGSFVFAPASGSNFTQADIGKEAYANTDWEVATSPTGLTNAYKVGTVVSLETTASGTAGVRVRIDNYSV